MRHLFVAIVFIFFIYGFSANAKRFFISGGLSSIKLISNNTVLNGLSDDGWTGSIGKLNPEGTFAWEATYSRWRLTEDVPEAEYPDATSDIEIQEGSYGFRVFTSFWVNWSIAVDYTRVIRKIKDSSGIPISNSQVNFDKKKFGGHVTLGLLIPIHRQIDIFAEYHYRGNDFYQGHGGILGLRIYTRKKRASSK